MLIHYEVALSFSGKQREYVRQVAEYLRDSNVLVFYDEFEEAILWGKDLVEHLHHIYAESADYCVIFISKDYIDGVWTRHEKRSVLEAALHSRREYILPARFDDSKLTGLPTTTAYLDCTLKTPGELAQLILAKLGKLRSSDSGPTATATSQLDLSRSILDTIRHQAKRYRNGRVPSSAIADYLSIPVESLRDSLVALYYNQSIEFHSGSRVSLAE